MSARFGTAQPRVEDPRLLTGAGRFTGDIECPEALSMAILRATHGAGRIATLDIDAARSLPGVRLVLTGADLVRAGLSPFKIQFVPPHIDRDIRPTPYYALSVDAVHWCGEPVAAVIADSPALAQDALELIVLDIDEEEAVIEAADAPDARPVWDDRDGNLVFTSRQGNADEVARVMAEAPHVIRHRLEISRVTAMSLETRTCLAVPDRDGNQITLHTGTQAAHRVRDQLCSVLGMAPGELRVKVGDVGGSFGMRNSSYPEDVLAVLAARTLSRPVRWTASRSEAFLSDTQSREQSVEVALALDQTGRFLALDVQGTAPVGAQIGPMALHPMTANLAGLNGMYRMPVISAVMRGVHVNTQHMNPYRGAGRPEAIYVIERLVDIAAARLGVDPLDLRRRNLVAPDAMPYATPLGPVYDCGDFETVLDKAWTLSDPDGFAARRQASQAHGLLRGRGLCCAIEPAGGMPGRIAPEYAQISLDAEAGAVLRVGSNDTGQGHAGAIAQMLDALLGWDGPVRLICGDTGAVATGTGSFGSRTMGAVGSSMSVCARRILARATEDAAEVLGIGAGDLTFGEGRFSAPGRNRSLSLAELVLDHGHRYEADANVAADAPTYPNGVHVAEVDVDPETGAVRLDRYSIVDDVGRVVNPMTMAGQLHGGIAKGLGQAFGERLVFDPDTGNLLTGSLMDYAVPRAADLVSFAVDDAPTATRANPLGTKGAGEAGVVGSLAAGINAVCDALKPLGIDHIDMPASPGRVWQAIRTAKLRMEEPRP